MSKIMENLINNKFYETKKDVEGKLNVFFAFNVITQEEYTKLMQLAEEKYKETTTEETVTTE
ncbi:hypothetical protein [Clostridium butyricum]|uniref:hypothetical protein n=1 Tax=Clostridium butyricum TaxID=1492 RepID=UPI0012B939D3|nr:hypothetical protein [Clostridium butyricum]